MKQQLIRLGSNQPDLQEHIRPILDKIASGSRLDKVLKDLEHAAEGYLEIREAYTNAQAGEAVVIGDRPDEPSNREIEREIERGLEPYVDLQVDGSYDDFTDRYSVTLTARF